MVLTAQQKTIFMICNNGSSAPSLSPDRLVLCDECQYQIEGAGNGAYLQLLIKPIYKMLDLFLEHVLP